MNAARRLYQWTEGLELPIPRHGNALHPEKVKRLLHLELEGLTRVVIAERLGIRDLDVLTKYIRLAGRPLKQGRPPRDKQAMAKLTEHWAPMHTRSKK